MTTRTPFGYVDASTPDDVQEHGVSRTLIYSNPREGTVPAYLEQRPEKDAGEAGLDLIGGARLTPAGRRRISR
ncbi:MAG: hypothetical protein M3Q42_10440 [Pseudomonadota bacterium]|nr:hypothetical protein [Pseudomonadota bacterium]